DAACPKLILRFGPRPVECMYSVFLAKLISIQRQLAEHDMALVLSEVPASVLGIFRACRLDSYFLFADTLEHALAVPLPDPLPGKSTPPCQKPRCGGPMPGEEPEK